MGKQQGEQLVLALAHDEVHDNAQLWECVFQRSWTPGTG
jgi:hypothetical protein